MPEASKEMRGKTCLVTGANSGIGRTTAQGLAARGARVILACRNLDKAAAVAQEIRGATGNQLDRRAKRMTEDGEF
ncbi:MAG: SDR family NAD(P)-dependent oxidoreductase [Myxococcales bacterium]|nr:SDR family NAD(P)-dependent oxidoreductase [Myxococcales bacterium]